MEDKQEIIIRELKRRAEEMRFGSMKVEYRLWREAVYARDNWTCQECGSRNGIYLHAHHIKSFAKFPELRFALDNGVILCKVCHRKVHAGQLAKGDIIEKRETLGVGGIMATKI